MNHLHHPQIDSAQNYHIPSSINFSSHASTPFWVFQMNRSRFRNVHFIDAADDDRILGGFYQNGSITEKNALDMLAIFLIPEDPVHMFTVVSKSTKRVVSRVDSAVEISEYLVSCDSK